MKLTRSLAAVVIGAASIAVAGTAAAETELVIVSWGGAYSKSQQNAYHLPYMKLNPDIKIINDDSAPEAVAKLRAMNEVNNVTWDLVDAVAADAMRLCDEGLALPIDPDKDLAPAPDGTPASKDFGNLLVSEYFIPNIVYSTTFGYRTDKFKTKPTSVCDVFDLKKFPGKRSLEKKPINNFEWALLCDGVAPDKIYDVLGADGGVDRALKKLGTIKSQVIWWTKGAQTPQLLADGEVVIGSTYNGRLFSLIEEEKQPVAMLWDWQVFDLDGWIPDPAAGERARRVQHHGAGLQHPPRDLAGRCSRLDRRREGMRRESSQNRAPHIDPPRPGAPSAGLPAPNRQITWDRRKSW